MTSGLTHTQIIDLRRRVSRALARGREGTWAQSRLPDDERAVLEVVIDVVSDMKREGKL